MPESQQICLQGGTCIHLLHGGYRYSEHLDFAGSFIDQELTSKIIKKSRSAVEKGMVQIISNFDLFNKRTLIMESPPKELFNLHWMNGTGISKNIEIYRNLEGLEPSQIDVSR